MKRAALIVMAVAVAVLGDVIYPPAAWEHWDIDQANDQEIQEHVDCLLDRGACTSEISSLKEILPEIFTTYCEKCSNNQKKTGKKFTKFFVQKRPALWEQISEVYDSNGSYFKRFASRNLD